MVVMDIMSPGLTVSNLIYTKADLCSCVMTERVVVFSIYTIDLMRQLLNSYFPQRQLL